MLKVVRTGLAVARLVGAGTVERDEAEQLRDGDQRVAIDLHGEHLRGGLGAEDLRMRDRVHLLGARRGRGDGEDEAHASRHETCPPCASSSRCAHVPSP